MPRRWIWLLLTVFFLSSFPSLAVETAHTRTVARRKAARYKMKKKSKGPKVRYGKGKRSRVRR